MKDKQTYIFFNKFHDIFRVKAATLADAKSILPKDFYPEFYETSTNDFSGVPEV